jgi:hypothetical protein
MAKKEQDGLISYWRKEADNYQSQAEIARDLLRLRGAK